MSKNKGAVDTMTRGELVRNADRLGVEHTGTNDQLRERIRPLIEKETLPSA